MFAAMTAMDDWLARHRDTLGSGGVEAFCAFDTGHDLSPRFWGVPDRCPGDAARLAERVPGLPFVAPDLTANVACQRAYLALAAAELGHRPEPWRERAAASERALWSQCWRPDATAFFDRATTGMVPVRSDVLARVLACEIGGDDLAGALLRRHLMNPRAFLAPAGLTSLAMDDPRFDHDYTHNSWGGPVNLLTMLRAPDTFESTGHVAELVLARSGTLAALLATDRFPQTLDPWTGRPGFGDGYTPAMLWLLDDLERHTGILPTASGELWLSGWPPTRLANDPAEAVGYARDVGGERVELVADDQHVKVWRSGRPWLSFPTGWRVVTRGGDVADAVGLSPTPTAGELVVRSREGRAVLALTLGPNEHLSHAGRASPGFVPPVSSDMPAFDGSNRPPIDWAHHQSFAAHDL
jgi:hypothetical protein